MEKYKSKLELDKDHLQVVISDFFKKDAEEQRRARLSRILCRVAAAVIAAMALGYVVWLHVLVSRLQERNANLQMMLDIAVPLVVRDEMGLTKIAKGI